MNFVCVCVCASLGRDEVLDDFDDEGDSLNLNTCDAPTPAVYVCFANLHKHTENTSTFLRGVGFMLVSRGVNVRHARVRKGG